MMRLLCLQPYAATSHEALLGGWPRHSRHEMSTLSLPARFFKWRFRQAPIELARQIEARAAAGEAWDALWCTSMLDLATLRGLSPAAARLPAVVYFHENQLTYPTRYAEQRDAHFGLTNMTTALAAIASHKGSNAAPCVWWNSAYNRDSFLEALDQLLQAMPDYTMPGVVETIREASAVHYPGIELAKALPVDHKDEPPIVLWAARWEYDKRPEIFADALRELNQHGVAFRISIIGESFGQSPACFEQIREQFAGRLVRWGYQPTRETYESALAEADVVVSTSEHEFFGIAVAEAVSAGCRAVLPDALAYPEVWGENAVYHDGGASSVADAIELALADPQPSIPSTADRFAWSHLAPQMDDAIEALVPAK